MGAVMGSKNLKAIAVRGGCDVNIARPEAFLQACMEGRRDIIESQPHYEAYHAYGTPALLSSTAPAGVIAVRNYQRNTFEDWEALSGETLKREFVKTMRGCASCHVACGPFHNVQAGEFAGTFGEGPEYASAELGILMDCNNLAAELKYQELCNQLGIDIYSAGTGIAWAMECYERGILTDEDFDGRPLSFGDYQSVVDIVPKIAYRQGFGNILAEGEKRAPKLVGQGSEKFRYHVKGQSPVTEDPRAHKGFGLQNLTGTRGADHLKGNVLYMRHILRHTQINMDISGEGLMMDLRCPDGVGRAVKWGEDMTATLNSVGMCTRTLGSIQILTRLLCSATGVDFTNEELLVIGERIFNVQKAFNARQGLTRKDDDYSVPEKFTKEPIKDGPCKGMIFERDLMLDEYYQTREWDVETGLQTIKKLDKLGLMHVAEELEKVNAIK
jgi:aldehyde:ferredoxin oxidoreductase